MSFVNAYYEMFGRTAIMVEDQAVTGLSVPYGFEESCL